MKIARVHFYVENAAVWRDWFVSHLGFETVASGSSGITHTEVVKSGEILFALSSPLAATSPVAKFLRSHPPGVVDVAFFVEDLAKAIATAADRGAKILQRSERDRFGEKSVKWAKIAAWGAVSHTLIQTELEVFNTTVACSDLGIQPVGVERAIAFPSLFTNIDHVVLNVAAGDLERAVAWYENILGFEPQQTFEIQTDRSALRSRVMVHPKNGVQFPINEPVGDNSQIQEFLDENRGAGIQHIAMRSPNLVEAIALLRKAGLHFLAVPSTYYSKLQQRGLPLSDTELQEIAKQQILVDWQKTPVTQENPPPLLLQTFTQPIFKQPTFFFELIERRIGKLNGQLQPAQGFGEANFQALFEAIEREQLKRSSSG